MLKLYVTFMVFTMVACKDHLLGAEKCTWGPGYWCKSEANAKECGTISHCQQYVWKAQAPSTSSECALCEMVGQKILDYIKENKTENEIISEMEQLCTWCPDKDSCKKYIEEYGKQFIDFILEAENVHDLCTYLGLCSQEFKDILRRGDVLVKILAHKVSDIGCDTCTSLVGLAQKELKDNEDDIENTLNGICKNLPVDQEECDQFIDTVFEGGVDYFESMTAEEVCQMLGMCSADYKSMLGITPVKLGQEGQTVEEEMHF